MSSPFKPVDFSRVISDISRPKSMRSAALLLSIIYILAVSITGAWASERIQPEPLETCTQDGVLLHLDYYRPEKLTDQTFLLIPGYYLSLNTFKSLRIALLKRGYGVFVGQVRGHGRGDRVSGLGRDNGIDPIAKNDVPALLETVFKTSPHTTVHLIGQSMGGATSKAAFADEKTESRIFAAAEKYRARFGALSAMNAPISFEHFRLPLRLGNASVLGAMNLLITFYNDKMHFQEALFDLTTRLKESNGIIPSTAGHLMEETYISLAHRFLHRWVINSDFHSREAVRDLLSKQVSKRVNLNVGRDFSKLIHTGRSVMEPEDLVNVPTQVVINELDPLAPPQAGEKVFKRLGTPTKRLLTFQGLAHNDLVTADLLHLDSFDELIRFHEDPARTASEDPVRVIIPKHCDETFAPTSETPLISRLLRGILFAH